MSRRESGRTRRPYGPRGGIGSSGGGAVSGENTPMVIMGANCRAWWRADLGVTVETGVSQWLDQVAGLAATQATGASQPALTATGGPNSTPSILWDGVDDALECAAFARSNPQTIFIVGRNVSWTANDSMVNDASVTYILIQRTTTPILAMSAGAAGNNNPDATLGAYRRIQAEFTGSTSDRLLIGATAVTGANTGATSGTAPLFGRNAAATTFAHVEICEIGMFDAVPTAGQNTDLDSYVVGRYGAGLT